MYSQFALHSTHTTRWLWRALVATRWTLRCDVSLLIDINWRDDVELGLGCDVLLVTTRWTAVWSGCKWRPLVATFLPLLPSSSTHWTELSLPMRGTEYSCCSDPLRVHGNADRAARELKNITVIYPVRWTNVWYRTRGWSLGISRFDLIDLRSKV